MLQVSNKSRFQMTIIGRRRPEHRSGCLAWRWLITLRYFECVNVSWLLSFPTDSVLFGRKQISKKKKRFGTDKGKGSQIGGQFP